MTTSTHHSGLHFVEHNVRPEGKTATGDCVTRAIVMATDEDYSVVWMALTAAGGGNIKSSGRMTADCGVEHSVAKKYLATLGWKFVECPEGTKFTKDNLPDMCIASLVGHYVFVKNGIVYDLFDCRGKRVTEAYSVRVNNKREQHRSLQPSSRPCGCLT